MASSSSFEPIRPKFIDLSGSIPITSVGGSIQVANLHKSPEKEDPSMSIASLVHNIKKFSKE
jgi:hypothetical protein